MLTTSAAAAGQSAAGETRPRSRSARRYRSTTQAGSFRGSMSAISRRTVQQFAVGERRGERRDEVVQDWCCLPDEAGQVAGDGGVAGSGGEVGDEFGEVPGVLDDGLGQQLDVVVEVVVERPAG